MSQHKRFPRGNPARARHSAQQDAPLINRGVRTVLRTPFINPYL
jgi:hypothetical protein